MTTNKNFVSKRNDLPLTTNQNIAIPQVDNKFYSQPKKRKTLQSRLLFTILPTVLAPLAIASVIGFNFTQTQSRNNVTSKVNNSILLTSTSTQKFIDRAFETTNLLGSNPLIIESLKSGTQKVDTEGLTDKSIEEVENSFAATKLLEPNPQLNNHLQAVAENKGLAEIILTEKNGFNVAYSAPTSDFIQSDEQWWQIGAEKGKALLEPEFDESANAAVLELVNSIKDPQSNKLLGITKIGISVEKLNSAYKKLYFVAIF